MTLLERAPAPPRRARIAAIALALIGTLASRTADAHFRLDAPACYSRQNSLGDPQKSAPCGQADPGRPVSETGAVTAYVQGGMITLTINETIFHPGHYRIAIAQDQASLPADPPVTAGSTACGSAPIDPSPTLPVLADGVFVHTSPLSGPQTVQIPLPANFTCTNCVLQVIEFMSNHALNDPGGCYYHHCATVSVLPAGRDAGTSSDSATADSSAADSSTPDSATGADAGTTMDAQGTLDAADAGTTTPPARGCGCHVPATRTSRAPLAALAGLALALVSRRRRQPR